MTLYDLPSSGPTASDLATGFLKEANVEFENQLQRAEDLIQRFWYRNSDADGNGVLTGDEPSGIEILQAMGTNAKSTIDAAHARVTMLVTIATALGKPELVDLTKLAAPYEFTWNGDGSLDTYTLR